MANAKQEQAWRCALVALAAASLAAQPASAQSVAEFYKGRNVGMIVGGSPGGGFDTLARAIARHIGKHIPGNPNIVPRNMPGAGGLLAMDHLYNVAEKDGSVIALVGNTPPFVPLVTGKPARFDPLKMNWLGTPSTEAPLVLVWGTVPVHTVEDLRTRETTMGASGADSPQAFFGRLINATLGLKMKIITGYLGQNEIFIAMERGEVEGFPSVYYSSMTSTRPKWIPEGIARAILQYGPEPLADLPNVPWAPAPHQGSRRQGTDDGRQCAQCDGAAAGDAARRARRPARRHAQGAGRHVHRSGVQDGGREDRPDRERAAHRRAAVRRDPRSLRRGACRPSSGCASSRNRRWRTGADFPESES